MSEQDLSTPLRAESAPAPTELITSVGSLRALRVSKGFTIEDVAVRLKYAARYVEALESERMESLPQGVALRSLVRSYSKLLGIDPKPLEATLQSYIGGVAGGSGGAGSSAHSGGIANHTSIRTLGAHHVEHPRHSGGWVWLLLIFLIVGAVFGIAVWQGLLPSAWVPAWVEALFV
ncbi:helix-turn-helix domain-containing protein [Zwartia sp.]|uniref:helix-turn-helix domain-containing protein n=1 Tax=Zwartia sp. TaxID=2978004 RepID=UPI00271B0515|nr:helix-turn-helix domain-containing protein [Zwartia sp.]MDO9025475.1 helix-turn-helix domain-containing protein [Zwartia sp.]